MAERKVSGIAARIRESTASAWALLSDTDAYLSGTSALDHYEGELRRIRRELSSAAARDPSELRRIKGEIIGIRKRLRDEGHELALAQLQLKVGGFLSDMALAHGYRRLVLAVGDRKIVSLAGDANHRELYDLLERGAAGLGGNVRYHALWYRWVRKTMEISGADSEPKADFEELRAFCAAADGRHRILSALKRLP